MSTFLLSSGLLAAFVCLWTLFSLFLTLFVLPLALLFFVVPFNKSLSLSLSLSVILFFLFFFFFFSFFSFDFYLFIYLFVFCVFVLAFVSFVFRFTVDVFERQCS